MPSPGDPCPGFIAQTNRCWRMIYDKQLQANHCPDEPSWTVGGSAPQATAGGVVGLSRPPRGSHGIAGVRAAERRINRAWAELRPVLVDGKQVIVALSGRDDLN